MCTPNRSSRGEYIERQLGRGSSTLPRDSSFREPYASPIAPSQLMRARLWTGFARDRTYVGRLANLYQPSPARLL